MIINFFKSKVVFALSFCLLLSGCVGGGQGLGSFIPFVDPPAGDGDVNPSTSPFGSGEEECENLDVVSVSPSSIDFGLSELNHVECQTIAVNPCVTFDVEVDDSTDTYTETNDDGENEKLTHFSLFTDDTEVAGRLSDQQDAVTVCYKRAETGSFTGRVNFVMSSAGATYAYAIPLAGKTVEPLFTLSSPTEGQLVWEDDGVSSFDASSQAFKITASGTINRELADIITNDSFTLSVGDETQTVNFGTSFTFSTTISIPNTPAVYPVTFTIETTHGTLAKVVNVIRYYQPEGEVEIRDGSGALVSAVSSADAKETDSVTLTAGVNVENLDVSGPRAEYPVLATATVTRPDGVKLYYDAAGETWTGESVEPFEFYFDSFPFGESNNENGACSSAFESPETTYCMPLPSTGDLGRGSNVVEAKLCNEYSAYAGSCVVLSGTIIVDNDVPIINFTSPVENQVISMGTAITATGTLENFVATETTTADGVSTTTCLAKMWVNTAITQTPISLCDYMTVVTNEESDATSGNAGNIRKATFSVPLSDTPGFNALTQFTNLIYVAVTDGEHAAYKTVSFQRGDLNSSTTVGTSSKSGIKSASGSIQTGQLGEIASDGTTRHAPLMLNISEGTVNPSEGNVSTENLMKVLAKVLGDNINLGELITGGPLEKKGENGSCVAASSGEEGNCVEADPHGTAMEKARALIELNICNADPGYNSSVCKKYEGMYNEKGGENAIFFDRDDLADACGNVQTAAIVFYDQLQYIAEDYIEKQHIYGQDDYTSCNVYDDGDCPIGEWPREIAGTNLDFNDTYSAGVWDISGLNFKNTSDDGKSGNYVDVELSLTGKDGGPALWAHGVAYNLTQGGSSASQTGLDQANLEDPIIPVIFNFGKLSIKLRDAIQIKKVQLNDDGTEPICYEGNEVAAGTKREGVGACNFDCTGGQCTNKVIIDASKINIKSAGNDIDIDPYLGCAAYYRNLYGSSVQLPFGCDGGEVESILVETNSRYGQDFYAASDYGNNRALLELLKEVLLDTFKNTIGCAPEMMINENFKTLTLALDQTDDGLAVVSKDDASDPSFTVAVNLGDADIWVNNGSLKLKLPIALGAEGLARSALYGVTTKKLVTIGVDGGVSEETSVKTRNNGYVYREPEGEASQLLESMSRISQVTNEPYIGMAFGAEEFVNAAAHVLFKKGLQSVIELIDPEMVDKLNMSGPTTIGMDQVILGNFGICNQIDVLSVDFRRLLDGVSYLIEGEALHLDIILDKNQPPTLSILPVEGDDQAALVQVGLSNIQIDVKNLFSEGDNTYTIGDETIVRVRLDILLKLITRYDAATRRMEVYILGADQTPMYLSVINRGLTYDDSAVIGFIRDTVLPLVWENFGVDYTAGSSANVPSLAITLPSHATGFDNAVTVISQEEKDALGDVDGIIIENYLKSSAIGECGEGEAPQYSSNKGRGLKGSIKTVSTGSPSFLGGVTMRDVSVGVGSVSEMEIDDPCYALNNKPEGEEEPTAAALCEFGIEDVTFGEGFPDLFIDADTGFIMFSTQIGVDVTDALTEEVSP